MDESLMALLLSIATTVWTYVQHRWIEKQKKAARPSEALGAKPKGKQP